MHSWDWWPLNRWVDDWRHRMLYQSILEIDGPCSLAALVRQRLLLYVASAGVHLGDHDNILNLEWSFFLVEKILPFWSSCPCRWRWPHCRPSWMRQRGQAQASQSWPDTLQCRHSRRRRCCRCRRRGVCFARMGATSRCPLASGGSSGRRRSRSSSGWRPRRGSATPWQCSPQRRRRWHCRCAGTRRCPGLGPCDQPPGEHRGPLVQSISQIEI